MKRRFYWAFVAGALVSCATPGRRTSGLVSEGDLTQGYLIARSAVEGDPVVEIQLRKGGPGLRVVSFKEAVADSAPAQSCDGEGRLKGAVAFLQIHCASESHVFEIDFRGVAPADLAKESAVRVRSPATQEQWIPLTIQRRDRPYFH